MSAGKVTLYVEQGSTFERTIKITDGATPTPNPEDLTGQVFEGQIRKTIGSDVVVSTFAFEILDQTAELKGCVKMTLTDTQTSAIVLKSQKLAERTTEDFAFDIERTFVSGSKQRLLEGVVKVSPEVTRPVV